MLKNEIAKLDVEPKRTNTENIKNSIRKLREQIDLAKSTPETCPTCRQPWPEKIDLDIDTATAQLEEKISRLNVMEKQNNCFELVQELEAIDFKLDLSMEEVKIAIDSINNEDSYRELQDLSEYTEIKEPKRYTGTSMSYASTQNKYAARLEDLAEVDEPVEVNLSEVTTEIRGLKQQLTLQQSIQETQKRYQTIVETYKDQLEQDKETSEELKRFIKFIDQYRKAFGQNVIPLLKTTVSNIVAYLTDNKYQNIEINSDYGIVDYDYYSGSEQDSINFALRLAIAKVSRLGKFDSMLLDEIAASFDAAKEQKLLDVLKKQDMQLIYITHGDI
jgi:DNA repair exonuclease SbcCD ATPase subunit